MEKIKGIKFPKVKYKILHIDDVFPTISYFLHPEPNSPNWSKSFFDCYPKLKSKVKNARTDKEATGIEYEFFLEHYKNNRKLFIQRKNSIQAKWDAIESEIMSALSDIVEYKWTRPSDTIYAYITQNPICPRDIKQRYFHLFYNKSHENMVETTIHELLHFIYFDKWQSIFPETKEEQYDYPDLIWHLSEMMPQILLNDARIQKIFKYNFTAYDKYQDILINGKNLFDLLQELYNNRKDFIDFLKKSYEIMRDNEKIIKR